MNILKKISQRKPKSFLIDNKYEVIPAFELKGETYYMQSDPLNTLAGRGLTSLMFMEELLMRCDVNYLKQHIEATEKLMSGNAIRIADVARLNANLKERVNLLAAIPDHVYKLASIVFFTKDESPFHYDHKVAQKKIALWEKTEGMYSFFLQTPLKDLIPSLALPEQNSRQYLEVMEKIDNHHLKFLREVLSSRA